PAAEPPSCPSCRCTAPPSTWGSSVPRPPWASTPARCCGSWASKPTRSTRSRHGGSSHERHAEPRHDQGSRPARGLPVREGGHHPRGEDLPGGRPVRHRRLRHRVHVLREPQVGAQMADAEQMVAGIKRVPGVAYEAIWLNEAGLERAARLRDQLFLRPMFSVAATDTFMRKNTNRTVDERLEELPGWARRYQALGMDWLDVGCMA